MTSSGEISLELGHLRLAAKRFGDPQGTKLLAIHGWLDNAASFDPISSYFADYDVVAIDLPGHGRSDHRPVGAWYHYVDYLHDLRCCIDALGWTQFSLLGHSLGGALASVLAALLPDRVERLYLIEALGPISTNEDRTLDLLRDAMTDRLGTERRPLRVFDDLSAPIAARRQHPQMPLSQPAAELLVARGTRAVGAGYQWSSDPRLTFTSAIRMSEAQVRNCLAGVRCPTNLVVAEPAMPFIDYKLLMERAELLPDLHIQRMRGSHHLHMDQPEAVAAALRTAR